MEASDQELLHAFVWERSEDAFRRMVNRHLNLVFATARRILGDPQLAEEVAQGVFLLLARKAGDIGNQQPLAGWLYHTARHRALNASRAEGRRRQREQTAVAMQTNETNPEPEWIAAELEGALEELPAEDRDALVLRFLDNRQLREVGVELGISEEAARKRVSRALDKLRDIFGKRGVALSTGLLTTALAAQAGAAAPAGLGATIVASALTGLTAASATALVTQTTATTMNLFNLKTAAAILGAAAVTGTTTYLVQEREADRLRADYQTLNETHGRLAVEQQEARELIRRRDEQIAALKRDAADVHRLRAEVDGLSRKLAELEALRAKNIESEKALQQAARRLHEHATNNTALLQSSEHELQEKGAARMKEMRQIGLAGVMHADDFEGWFPNSLQDADPYLNGGRHFPGRPSVDYAGVERPFSGHSSDIKQPGGTIIARSVEIETSALGDKVWRFYAFADGHSEIKSGANVKEIDAWERERTIPPGLQSKRP